MKNIKEYKLKKKAHKYIDIIDCALNKTEQPSYQGENIKADSVNALTLNRLNVLDKWFKAVYEEEIKLPRLFGVEGVYKNEKHKPPKVVYRNAELPIHLINELLEYNIVSLSIVLDGRCKLINKEQLQQISDYFKKPKR